MPSESKAVATLNAEAQEQLNQSEYLEWFYLQQDVGEDVYEDIEVPLDFYIKGVDGVLPDFEQLMDTILTIGHSSFVDNPFQIAEFNEWWEEYTHSDSPGNLVSVHAANIDADDSYMFTNLGFFRDFIYRPLALLPEIYRLHRAGETLNPGFNGFSYSPDVDDLNLVDNWWLDVNGSDGTWYLDRWFDGATGVEPHTVNRLYLREILK